MPENLATRLYGKHINLRPLLPEDAQAMFSALQQTEINRLTGTTEHFEFAQVEQFCRYIQQQNDRADFAITSSENDDYIGEIVIMDIDTQNQNANFRIALNNSQRLNRGYGSEACRLLLQFAFTQLYLHRLELEVFSFNQRAIHVYQKLGFRREGVKRQVLLLDGEFHDAIIMSILAPEYQQRYTAGSK